MASLSQQYWNAAKQHLGQISGLGRQGVPNSGGYFPANWGTGYSGTGESGGLDLQYGTAPNDAQVNRYIAMTGGNPYSQRNPGVIGPGTGIGVPMTGFSGYGGGPAGPAGGGGGGIGAMSGQGLSMLLSLLGAQSQKKSQDKAREENLKRYDEIHQGYSDLGKRTQEKIGNWGKVQELLNEESAKATMGEINASLANRGLGGSTIGPAFQQRNARDLAMLQQDVSEKRDARAIAADEANTDRLLGAVERRNDTAPDNSAVFYQLAQQLGQYGGANPFIPQNGYVPPSSSGPNYSGGGGQGLGALGGFSGFGTSFGGIGMPVMSNMFAGVGDYLQQFQPTPMPQANRYPYNPYAGGGQVSAQPQQQQTRRPRQPLTGDYQTPISPQRQLPSTAIPYPDFRQFAYA